MQAYDEFFKTVSEETKSEVAALLSSVAPELNELGPIILISKNPEDINKVKKVKVCWCKN